MPQHGVRHCLEILLPHEVAAVQHRARLGSTNEVLDGTRPGTPRDEFFAKVRRIVGGRSRGAHDVHREIVNVIWHRHALDQFLILENLLAVDPGLNGLRCVAGGLAGNTQFLVAVGVLNLHKKHEPVELRFRQGVGTLLLDRVLRGQHKKRLWQREDAAGHGDVMFLHGLEQCGLRLGRRAVDFVGEDDVGEDRSLYELKLPPALGGLLQDIRAGDVGRHQVGRELNAVEVERHHPGQRVDHECLSQARYSHEQRVAAREDGDEQALNDLVLSYDDLGHLGLHAVVGGAQFVDDGYVALTRRGRAVVGLVQGFYYWSRF